MGTLIRAHLAALLAALVFAATARADAVEGVLMPGKVIAGHAKLESECQNCHVRFNKAAQDRLCLDCHKEVARDVAQRQGHHGRLKPQPCRSCHTDHKGREAKIVHLDEKNFDHAQTDFALRGAHGKLPCADCHKAKARHREAPSACSACHRKDDVHKGGLGAKCADCHGEANWKETRFDHGRTKFALKGQHAEAKCKECHADNRFKETPQACVSCHRKDDNAKGHKGRYGEKCETCHGEQDWKTLHFSHDRDTKHLLRGKHQSAKCDSCHTGVLYRDRLATGCNACHRKDDMAKGHKGELGTACADCHTERGWKETRFDHGKTAFPLRGRHADAECKSCHRDARYKETPKACVGCHRGDDNEKGHKGRYGEKCETCHGEKDWKTLHFSHDRDTRYPLRDKHRQVKCVACHTGVLYRDKTPGDCLSCHRKDDKHKGQQGAKCEQCHSERSWTATSFDHARSRFPLVGRHLKVECKQCHQGLTFKDARSECVACHEKEDVHKRRLGPQCETCHNARDWRIWDFDHDKRSRYRLDGAHRMLACTACHRNPVEKKISLPLSCVGCHEQDDMHEGGFGKRCERCHVTSSFKKIKVGSGGGG